MAIYHLEMKVISRGPGRSACAASAYMSCSRIYNDYDGIQHDYTRKRGLVWEQVFLPEHAPSAWQEREILWNAVEEAEKAKDSRLAREFVVALPAELEQDAWIILLTEFVQTQFVADGMCADVAIHANDTNNPHAHIMLTIRPLQENGSWQKKTEKEYLCMKDGIECGFTAAEYKTAQKDGWEKQYPYFVGKKKKEYMTPSAAAAIGYERASKYPKSTKYGRQNPISARWNSEDQLLRWRENWADTVNRALEDHKPEIRIDHRSFAARGLAEQPTIHEGFIARAMEKQGVFADRCEINRQIRADNKLLRQLREQMDKLAAAVTDRIPAIAEQLETIRSGIIRLYYHRQANDNSIWALQDTIDRTTPAVEAYMEAGLRLARLQENSSLLKMRLQSLQQNNERQPEEPGYTPSHSSPRSRKHRDELEH